MGAKIDRATHYIFGTAFYTLLVNLLSDKFNIIISPLSAYKIIKEAYSSGIHDSILFSIMIISLFFLTILSMRISVIPDSIDKPSIDENSHRKFGHSLIFLSLCSICSYFALYSSCYYILSFLLSHSPLIEQPYSSYYKVFHTAIDIFSKMLSINISIMIFSSLLSHLILDVITYSGIPLFYPISKRYFSLKLVKSGSPIFILILFLSLFYLFIYSFFPLFSSFLIILSGGEAIKYGW